MATKEKANPADLIPSALVHLSYKDLVPSVSNPRQLFDPEPLKDLRENIRNHGVLVPLVVYRMAGGDKYGIIDGARRHLCCKELAEEGKSVSIPCNVVTPPTKVASLLYMFNIHNFRQGWDLMPTAIGLKTVIEELGETDTKKLSNLTGLSEPQVERCKVLISLPEEFRKLSLEKDPKARIPSNFWIEALPVVDIAKEVIPDLYKEQTRSGVLRRLVDKYRAKKIKSVIHFRRIVEASENTKGTSEGRSQFKRVLSDYITKTELETRAAFDGFVEDARRVRTALDACEAFLETLKKVRAEHITDDRKQLTAQLKVAKRYIERLISHLEEEDDPRVEEGES